MGLIIYEAHKECKWINHRLPRDLNFKKKCLTSTATRFVVGDLIKLSFGPFAGNYTFYGIVLTILDSDPYRFSYEVRWINKPSNSVEEIDGIWLEDSKNILED